jgi:hypothetical protein
MFWLAYVSWVQWLSPEDGKSFFFRNVVIFNCLTMDKVLHNVSDMNVVLSLSKVQEVRIRIISTVAEVTNFFISSKIITSQQRFQQTSLKGHRLSQSGNTEMFRNRVDKRVGSKAPVFPSPVDKHQLRWSTSFIY